MSPLLSPDTRSPAPALAELLSRFLQVLEIRRLSRATLAAYRMTGRRFVAFLASRQVVSAPDMSGQDLTDFLWTVSRPPGRAPLAANSLAMYDKVIRAFTAWLTRERHMLFDPAARLTRSRTPPPGLPWVPSESEVAALLAACPVDTALGIRTRTLLELLYGSALRLGEAMGLTLSDCDIESGRLFIGSAKGNRDRIVPMSDGARLWLGRYLERARPTFVWKDRPTPTLFVSSRTGRPLGILMARLSFHEARRAAGLALPLVPHSLRHAAATHLLAAGCDLAYIRQLLGHASLAMTERYTTVVIDDLVEAHRRFHPAFQQRDRAPGSRPRPRP